MADEESRNSHDDQSELDQESSKSSGKKAFFVRFLTIKRLAVIMGGLIVLQMGVYIAYRWSATSSTVQPNPEVSLGEFQFEADRGETGRIAAAEFSLHIALLDHVDKAARKRLFARKFRLQQGIEELLRQAHGSDFDDPNLGDLKRQLQEQINETLGIRAIADVIITDLKLEPSDHESSSAGQTTESVPWTEGSDGLTRIIH